MVINLVAQHVSYPMSNRIYLYGYKKKRVAFVWRVCASVQYGINNPYAPISNRSAE